MVFQSYALYPHMSVRQNMAFGLENAHLPRPEIDKRIAEASRMLEIAGLLERRPGQLSGGQRQRVAIGRAIVRNPTAFLLDEPLSNLDAELRVSMRAELAALHARLGTTMIYVTHDQVEAMTLADRIVVLRAGRIEQVDTPLALFNKPANTFVAGFIGAPNMNFVPGVVRGAVRGGVEVEAFDGRRVPVAAADGALAIGDTVTLGVRPHHLRRVEAETGLPVTVRLVEALGAETVVHGQTGEGQKILAVLAGQERLSGGDVITLAFTREQTHLFDKDGLRVAGN
jgi:multiple sugar transport system ATP-binding protein